LGITDPLVAYALDEALALRLHLSTEQRAGASARPAVTPPPGFRFESAEDWGVPMYDEQRREQRRREMLAEYGRR
jgi:hypothetical protein